MQNYQYVCKNCGESCDGVYCSYECQQEWEEGYGEYLWEREQDRKLMED